MAVSRAKDGLLNAKSEFCWASLWFSQGNARRIWLGWTKTNVILFKMTLLPMYTHGCAPVALGHIASSFSPVASLPIERE